MGFIDLEKAYDGVNKEALWQVLRMYDVGSKLLSGIKSMYVDSSACVEVKGAESEWFRIDSGVKPECIIPGRWERVKITWLLEYMHLVLCGESEEDLKGMVGQFAEVCRRRGLKVNAGKSKVMVLNGEERLECEVHIDRIRLEYVSEFKYLGCVLDESGTDGQIVVGR